MFIGKTDAEAETPIRQWHDVNNWLIEKDPNAGKGWRQKKGTMDNGITDMMDMSLNKLQEFLMEREA